MRNDVSFKKARAFKSKPKLFYEKFFYFVSIALGSLQKLTEKIQKNSVSLLKNQNICVILLASHKKWLVNRVGTYAFSAV